MRFIKVTQSENVAYVAVAQIKEIGPIPYAEGTDTFYGRGFRAYITTQSNEMYVKETPEQIMEQINTRDKPIGPSSGYSKDWGPHGAR